MQYVTLDYTLDHTIAFNKFLGRNVKIFHDASHWNEYLAAHLCDEKAKFMILN